MGVIDRILIVLIFLLLFIGIRAIMRNRAIGKIKETRSSNKKMIFNKMLQPYGLSYNPQEDLVESVMDPWQRKFGYCSLYDEYAAKVNMILDCEPIYFTYDNRQWMLELWKGQYVFATGAEIGLYVMEEEIEIPGIFHGPFFRCAKDEEQIGMKFRLLRDGKELCTREAWHWWLTGFLVGTFSETDQLTMEVDLTFPNEEMRDSFIHALVQMGYGTSGIGVTGNSVLFIYDRPMTRQPKRRKIRTAIRQKSNRWICGWYNYTTGKLNSTLDKTLFLRYYYPIAGHFFWRAFKKIKIETLLEKPYRIIKLFSKK